MSTSRVGMASKRRFEINVNIINYLIRSENKNTAPSRSLNKSRETQHSTMLYWVDT
jgi:hypothetical protein